MEKEIDANKCISKNAGLTQDNVEANKPRRSISKYFPQKEASPGFGGGRGGCC